jgi:hypothetical protein
MTYSTSPPDPRKPWLNKPALTVAPGTPAESAMEPGIPTAPSTPAVNGAVRPVHVTFFPNQSAQILSTKDMTLEELRDLILGTTAATKFKLPWLKLAKFGNKRSDKNCLRHDENVLAITGVELDYDASVMPFSEAVKIAEKAHLRALLYTTANYKEEAPKWRVLLPTSCDLEPKERKNLVARVNGLFGGIFANESFALSQTYLFGSINSNASHRAVIVEGDFIDLRSDLDAGKLGKSKKPKAKGNSREGNKDASGLDHLARLGDGDGLEGFNGPLCSATSAYAKKHGAKFDQAELKERLRAAIERAPKGPDRSPDDILRYLSDSYLDNLITSAVEKYGGGVSPEDFDAYMPAHNYIYTPSREPWPASSVDARLGKIPLFDEEGKPLLDKDGNQLEQRASVWLDKNRPVEQMTWAPGLPMLIRDRLVLEGGWIEQARVTCLNLYRPPTIEAGNAAQADRWLDHVHKVFGEENADHITKYLAHRVQKPQEKINHALVLGGNQGIGKDTLLEPVKYAVGPWNFSEVSPQHMLGRFNGFLKSVILRVNEARDLGDVNRYQFYDHLKAYTAAPPDVLRVDEKNLREHSIFNCCGVIITTNYQSNGIYLPADDRRHFVGWSDLTKDDFVDDYWNDLWSWYAKDGIRHVAAYLTELDLSGFDPKAPPPKTAAFWAIVDANRAPEDAELADVLDKLGNPDATTVVDITAKAAGAFFEWITDRKNRRVIPHRLESCGYVPVRNDAAKDGYYVIGGRRQAVYGRAELSVSERFKAAGELASRQWAE